MCYKKPGPRCSAHARQALEKARAGGDKDLIREAKREYFLTPDGIKALRKQGRDDVADKMLAKRSQLIVSLKEHEQNRQIILEQMREFEGIPYHGETLKLIDNYTRKYGEPMIGRTRAVFDRGDGYMLKVPLNGEGMMANSSEIMTYEANDSFIPVAECRIETDYSGSSDGIGVMVMEKVDIEPVQNMSYNDLPDWVGYVDCAQVGYDKKGRLVAYDL